jgi:hypothetical protein
MYDLRPKLNTVLDLSRATVNIDTMSGCLCFSATGQSLSNYVHSELRPVPAANVFNSDYIKLSITILCPTP